MPGFRAVSSALAAAACAAGLGACGGDDEGGPIPPDQGNQLIATLDEIEAEVQAGDCDRARQLAVVVAENVSTLPLDEDDDAELRDALVTATRNLEELTEDPNQCTPIGATGETGTVPTTETTTTTTEPPTTTTTEEPEEDDEGGGPPDEPPGGGNGDPGGGNGNGGGGDTGGGDFSGGIGSDG